MAGGKTTDSKTYINWAYDQIRSAGVNIHQMGQEYQRSLGLFGEKGSTNIPKGGDSLVDHMMANVMSMTYDLHQLVGDAMQNHGSKMQNAADYMKDKEAKSVEAIYSMLGGGPNNLTVSPYQPSDDGHNPDSLGAKEYASGVRESAFRPMPSFTTIPATPAPYLAPVQRNLVGGDPLGLTNLATALTDFIKSHGKHIFDELKDSVESLVKDDDDVGGYQADSSGGWIGPTAYAFRAAYITDAATMNGLHCVMCQTAGILNDLASELTMAEKRIEQVLYSRQSDVESRLRSELGNYGALPNYIGWFSAQRIRGRQYLIINGPVDSVTSDVLRAETGSHFEEAEAARHKAANRLAGMGELLLSGIQYYQAHSSNTADGVGTLITADDYTGATNPHGKHTANLDTLTKNLVNYQSQLNLKPSDNNVVMNDLKNIGANTSSAAEILGAMRDFKKAEGALGKGKEIGSVIGKLLPLIAEIGIAAA